jgi:hypothetical protein
MRPTSSPSPILQVPCSDIPRKHRAWVINDVIDQRYHKIVRLSESPLYLQLSWRRDSASPVFQLGCFRFELDLLLQQHYVRKEGPGLRDHEIRLRLQRGADKIIYVQIKRDSPKLRVAELPSAALRVLQ